ncbi:MAG: ABC transporter substrate-binding protein [Desulfosudaceae bacterium]
MKLPTIIMSMAVLTMMLTVPAGAAAEEGVTATEIHIGQTGPLSGPASIWGGTVKGAALRFQMANENGGIHGRKIVHHTYDDAYNPAKTKAGVKQLQESIGMFAWLGGVGTSNGQAVMDYLMERQIPWVGPFSGADIWHTPPKKNIFALYPPYTFEVKALCDYAVTQEEKKRIAMVYQDDGYGHDGLKGAHQALNKYQMDLVAAIPVGRDDVNFAPVAVKLRQANPDAVLIWISPFSALRFLKVARQADLDPLWMSSSSLSSCSTFHEISQGLVEGLVSLNFTTMNEEILNRYKAAQLRLAPQDTWDTTYVAGLYFADCMVEALQRCGQNLTRKRFVKALESMRDYNHLGPTTLSSFDPNDPLCRLGTQSIRLDQCREGGQVEHLTNWVPMN